MFSGNCVLIRYEHLSLSVLEKIFWNAMWMGFNYKCLWEQLEANKKHRSYYREDIKNNSVTFFLWFVLSSWHWIGKVRSWENFVLVWEITGNIFYVCAFLVSKLKVGNGMHGKKHTMETLILSEAVVKRASWSCQRLFVLSSKILVSLLQNLARKAAF